MKLKSILVLCGVVAFVELVWAKTDRQSIQINNQRCPVTGNPVNDQDTYVYKGKEYKLCGEQCKQPLSENPKKYLSD